LPLPKPVKGTIVAPNPRESGECRFNTDQGAQFTSDEFTKMLQVHGIEISMDGQDGRGCCHGNIFVERLWWTMKHEWVCLCPAANGIEQKRILAESQPEPPLHHALPGH
jgi:transposase InsO family protein